jgi:hypothetical protein
MPPANPRDGVVVLEGYQRSDEVREIALGLIASYDRFRGTDEHRVEYALLHGVDVDDSRIHTIAKAVKTPPLWRDLTGVEAAVWVNAKWWRVADERSRQAVVAHELCHLYEDDKGRLAISEHDVEEFAFVARYFGAWRGELTQLRLALDEGPAGGRA